MSVEVSAIMAVAQVEAGGRHGFAADGRPIVRYELHIFHGRTAGKYHQTHPHLSQPSLKAGNPFHRGGQANEWSLIFGAMILRDAARNRKAADLSRVMEQEQDCCSFLRFQLAIEPNAGPVTFEVTGPAGTGDMLRKL